MIKQTEYIYSVENALRACYGIGFDSAVNTIMDYVDKVSHCDKSLQLLLRSVIYNAVNDFYEKCSDSQDAKNRVLKRDREKIAELKSRIA